MSNACVIDMDWSERIGNHRITSLSISSLFCLNSSGAPFSALYALIGGRCRYLNGHELGCTIMLFACLPVQLGEAEIPRRKVGYLTVFI